MRLGAGGFPELPRRHGGRASPASDDAVRALIHTVLDVDDVELLLRRLSLNDERSVEMVMVHGHDLERGPVLTPKLDLLVRLGALLALGAATSSLRSTVNRARGAGATDEEIVGVLIAVAPAVGLARVVASAPRLASAIGYDLFQDE